MALPKIEHPVINVYLKSLDREVKFRPFLVKEERLLLIAKESKDINEIRSAITHIIQNCCLEDDVSIENLPLFDVEMAFIKIRAKSVGESIKFEYVCRNEIPGEDGQEIACGGKTDYSVNLENVIFKTSEAHTDKVMITPEVGMKLKYPSLDMEITLDEDEDRYTQMLKILIENIDYIFDDVSVYKIDDLSRQDLLEYISNITVESLEKIKTFFKESPTVVLEDDIECRKCGYKHHMVVEDILSFFI